jgi:hypothetical protein
VCVCVCVCVYLTLRHVFSLRALTNYNQIGSQVGGEFVSQEPRCLRVSLWAGVDDLLGVVLDGLLCIDLHRQDPSCESHSEWWGCLGSVIWGGEGRVEWWVSKSPQADWGTAGGSPDKDMARQGPSIAQTYFDASDARTDHCPKTFSKYRIFEFISPHYIARTQPPPSFLSQNTMPRGRHVNWKR